MLSPPPSGGLGVLGTVFSAAGILGEFISFLTAVGIVVPPIVGIMIVDYYLLRRHREQLEESAGSGALPASQEKLNPVTLFTWAVAAMTGYVFQWGIPALNSLMCAAVLYYVTMKIVAIVKRQDRVVFSRPSINSTMCPSSYPRLEDLWTGRHGPAPVLHCVFRQR
jgi:cytosine permease